MFKNLLLLYLGYEFLRSKGMIGAKPVGEEFGEDLSGGSMDAQGKPLKRMPLQSGFFDPFKASQVRNRGAGLIRRRGKKKAPRARLGARVGIGPKPGAPAPRPKRLTRKKRRGRKAPQVITRPGSGGRLVAQRFAARPVRGRRKKKLSRAQKKRMIQARRVQQAAIARGASPMQARAAAIRFTRSQSQRPTQAQATRLAMNIMGGKRGPGARTLSQARLASGVSAGGPSRPAQKQGLPRKRRFGRFQQSADSSMKGFGQTG